MWESNQIDNASFILKKTDKQVFFATNHKQLNKVSGEFKCVTQFSM